MHLATHSKHAHLHTFPDKIPNHRYRPWCIDDDDDAKPFRVVVLVDGGNKREHVQSSMQHAAWSEASGIEDARKLGYWSA